MESLGILVGVILCSVGITNCELNLNVSEDVSVIPEALLKVNQSVDIQLTCTGSEDLSHYINNPITWSYIDHLNNEYLLTKSFYPQTGSAGIFENGHHVVTYTENPPIEFNLKIVGVRDSDNGIYRCAQRDSKMEITLDKNVTITVLRPVERMELEIRDLNDDLLRKAGTKLSFGEPPISLSPGDYMVKCSAFMSNPAPLITFTQTIGEATNSPKYFMEYDAKTKRIEYTGVDVRRISISPWPEEQQIECNANVPGDTFPAQSAGMSIKVEKPTIKCSTEADDNGSVYNISCNVSAMQTLDCSKVTWKEGDTAYEVKTSNKPQDQSDGASNMTKMACNKVDDRLETMIVVSKFEHEYAVIYGNGEFAHSQTVVLSQPPNDGNMVYKPSSGSDSVGMFSMTMFSICFAMYSVALE